MDIKQSENLLLDTTNNERNIPDLLMKNLPIKVAITGIMGSLICVLTAFLAIPIPATEGYFNFGELLVFTTAILFGPIIGGLAGGIGSSLADLLSGAYSFYWPYTLVAKGLEGLVVGLIFKKFKERDDKETQFKQFLIISGLVAGILIAVIGESIAWIIIGVIISTSIILITIGFHQTIRNKIFAIIIGGSIMVSVYLISEFYILDYGTSAFFELPANISQVIIGMIIAIPLTERIEKMDILQSL